MEFTFQTNLDYKAITAMVKAMGKTVGKKKKRLEQVFRWAIILLAFLLTFTSDPFDTRAFLLLLCALLMLSLILFEDKILAYVSKKRLLPGMELEDSRFSDTSFTTVASVGTSEFQYDRILAMAEDKEY